MQKKGTIYSLLLTFLLGMVMATVVAQTNSEVTGNGLETRAFDEAVWQKLNEELDYSGEAPKPKETKEKEEGDGFNIDELPTLSPILQFILMSILVALLAWLIYSLVIAKDEKLSVTKAYKEQEEEIALKRLEEELDKSDVYPLLFQAEQDENYHLAVRLHFLALLKKLHTNGNIQWKKDLTNRAYLRQMHSQQAFPAFRALTSTFERVWYGNQVPNEAEYQQIKTKFNAFKSTAAKHANTPADE